MLCRRKGVFADGVKECESVHLWSPGMFLQRLEEGNVREMGPLPVFTALWWDAERRNLPRSPSMSQLWRYWGVPGTAYRRFQAGDRLEWNILSWSYHKHNTMGIHSQTGTHLDTQQVHMGPLWDRNWSRPSSSGPLILGQTGLIKFPECNESEQEWHEMQPL